MLRDKLKSLIKEAMIKKLSAHDKEAIVGAALLAAGAAGAAGYIEHGRRKAKKSRWKDWLRKA